MGMPMSVNLARAGFSVRAWNRSPRGLPGVADYRLCDSVAGACAGARVIITMLPDISQVREVCAQALAHASPGALVVVMGTVSPVAVRAWAGELAADGFRVIDAPVSGGDVGAQDGTLSIMAGGSPADVESLRGVFDAMGSVTRHLGPVGSGQLAKACNQIVVATTLAALGEAVTLGAKGGLDVDSLLDVLAGGLAGSRALEVKRAKLSEHNFTPGGSAAFQHKDLGFALDAARVSGVALPVTAVVDQLFGVMRWTGHGDEDHSGILGIIERLSGAAD
jgi:2-hydroxy-3-oxopropionate reductase